VLNCAEHAFAPDTPGRIEVHARRDGDIVELDLIDDGQGIAPESLDRIFDPFFTTRRGQGGTGLGLNIVYNLVAKLFCGTITARSTVGQGTRFTLRIPRVTPQRDGAETGVAESAGAPPAF
jgi:two-component system NtrC family sensor kinase